MMSHRDMREPLPDSKIRRDAVGMLRSLKVLPSARIEDVCEELGEMRGRPLVLLPRSFPNSSVYGLWLKTTSTDFVVYERDATPDHREHIIRHEIGHILFDHENPPQSDDDALSALVPTLPLEVVQRALRRSCYDSAAEREAEIFASVMTDLARQDRRSKSGVAPANILEEGLGGRRKW